jgi:hypothetical protein
MKIEERNSTLKLTAGHAQTLEAMKKNCDSNLPGSRAG